ncbi:MAG TPA: AEC family transporter [Geobacterales bacterium]|nr:AEC family transporter [Geobacterales bacterium]
MANIILLVVCFLAGMLLQRTGRFPESTPVALNGFIIHVSLPALALLHIHELQLNATLVYPALMAWLLFGFSLLFFWGVGRLMGLDRATTGALMLVAGLGNTSFVGLPMIEAYYGHDFIAVGLIADQLGSFLVLSTLGILVATLARSGAITPRTMARRVFFFPPFQALLLALLLRPFPFPQWLPLVLKKLGDTLTPLALVSVGFQLRFANLRGEMKPLALGLSYKLLLGPALLFLIYVVFLGASGPVIRVTLFEAAMAPMITAGIIAVDHDLNPPLVTLLLGIGIPLSFLTLPGWWWLLQRV